MACEGSDLLMDRISGLPDDIIVYIVSMLKMKEAGRTSVLSKRWRYVWAHIPVLHFDASDTMVDIFNEKKELEAERPRYLQWVNQVVRSYKGPTIDEFTIEFDIDRSSKKDNDNWVRFVAKKKVKKLNFNFSSSHGGSQYGSVAYVFPDWCFCNSLTSIQLTSVQVSGDVICSFIRNCPQLEYVKVKRSTIYRNLKIASTKLKYMEIYFCYPINVIEISAPNLVTFKYYGHDKISLSFKSTTKPTELMIGGGYAVYSMENNFPTLWSYFSLLESLTLNIGSPKLISIHEFPECKMLKELELTVCPGVEMNLFGLSTIIKACPYLHKFVLELGWTEEPSLDTEQLKVKASSHDHLKILEVRGRFFGHPTEIEFIMYLVESAVALEKIVIDTRHLIYVFPGTTMEFTLEKEERTINARKEADKLSEVLRKLKPEACLIIL